LPEPEHMSLARRILDSKRPFVFFHTYSVTRAVLRRAIDEQKSMDFDVCVDDDGRAFLGHSEEYHEKSGEARQPNMPLWEAVDMVSESTIPVIVDCKHPDAWPVVEEVVGRIGPARCLVHSFAIEFRFDYTRADGEPDFTTEWSPIEVLRSFKSKSRSVTTCAGAKWLPDDLLVSHRHSELVRDIRRILKDNGVDTVCLNVPDETWSDRWLRYFLEESIIPFVGVDEIDVSRLSEVFIGETDDLGTASRCTFFQEEAS
jgi:hypothetical protein